MAAMCCETAAFIGMMSFKRFLSRSPAISSRIYNLVCANGVCRYHRSANRLNICTRSDAKLSRNSCHRWSSLEDLNQRRCYYSLQNTGFLGVIWTPHSIHRFLTSDGSDRPGKFSIEVTERPQEREGVWGEGSENVTDFGIAQGTQETVTTAESTEEEKTFGDTRRERLKGVLSIDDLVEELRGENAKDICVIKVPLSLKYVDFLVIVSGSSTRHLKSMAQYIISLHKARKDAKDKFVTVEGADCDDWMAIDLGNIALHMMLPETREKYELEKLWTLGSEYDDQTRAISFLDFPFTLSDQFALQTEE
ncbi:uncharacterized protein [Branchiostoma lanceolatum]|uniref:uncharacterized protein n=1 Tax=Branchiostoma lanceolatum TaxID=7740 RepID=UPI003455584F